MHPPLVDIHDLTFSYNGKIVLKDVNLKIHTGDFIAVIGPNGGGKTTLLKLILGLFKPDKGRIEVMGRKARKAATDIGYVPQNVNINSDFPITALDVVKMGQLSPRRKKNNHKTAHLKDVYDVLERMDMNAHAQKKINELSGGQRQRVFIARALVTHPRLLLLDEPTASIDTKGQADFFKLLEMLNQEITIVIVSHDLMVVSRYVKSVACVNKSLHFHDQAEITGEMLQTMYNCSTDETCPIELVAHGLPHRVLKSHEEIPHA